MAIETSILDIIEGKRKAPIAKALLRVMSECYRAGVRLRNLSYDRILPSKKLDTPVISIGNIVTGGAGKTPFVIYLAEALSSANIVILSRGYKRKSNRTVFVDKETKPTVCGDEPLLLAQKLPKATVVVNSNRAWAASLAEKLEPDLFILDDGMQYRQLYRDYEIVVMDAENLLGKGFYLPRGLLRDSPRRLSEARLIILNSVQNEDHYKEIEPLIRKYTDAPITCMQLVVDNRISLASKKVASFCGIAAPHRFQNTLKTLGCDIVMKREKPDHDPFTTQELDQFANLALADGAQALVCTEKDAVKLPENLVLPLPVIVARISLKPWIGKEHLDTFIQEVTP